MIEIALFTDNLHSEKEIWEELSKIWKKLWELQRKRTHPENYSSNSAKD